FEWQVTPNFEEREVLALLLVAGEQFDSIKSRILSPRIHPDTFTVFGAAHMLEFFLKTSEFAPPSEWPEVIKIAKQYKHRIQELVKSIGRKRIDVYNYETEPTLLEACIWDNVKLKIDHSINATVPPALRNPFKREELSIVRKVVELLSQPKLKEFKLVVMRGKTTAEDPCLSTRPQIRPARQRRISLAEGAIDWDERILNTSDIRTAAHEMEKERNESIIYDTVYEDHEIMPYRTYCRNKEASMKERWACSSSLREGGAHNDAHDDCKEKMWKESDQSREGLLSVFWMERRIQTREFEFLHDERRYERRTV
ncbi:hypothetical protein PFISCL1PPCAC_3052, partial [Pristionchus fissidentatus]